MGKELKVPDIIAQLQRHRGYKGWRMRPHWRQANLWIAQYYTYIGRGDKKGWRVLRDEKEQYRTFRTPELAYMALAKQQAEWQKELGEHDQTFKVVSMSEEEKRLGRIYPFCYKQWHDEAEESLGDLLRAWGGEIIWLLDIRFDPEGPPYGFRGSWLKHMRPTQYRHAKGLGLVSGQLYYPSSAVREILRLLREGESFVLFSGDLDHVKMVETLVRDQARTQNILLEDPYTLNAGDLCLWKKREASTQEVVLHHRTPDVYSFLADFLDERISGEYVDIRDLQVVTVGAYRCDECGKGEKTVRWREQPQKKLCRHCFWEWGLEYGE
ncbi:hypothetical protein C5B42_01350 [Candidatus Cerribacteria bacterium 'Amazon FNV 2010 28 9']|uniref:Uncharacterized protein n=1 Tax=Candidatus Cerribacteria bacterium 'Amazon FNV 2010 28 9' TaxID=2081795 RepID=A0A317JTM1_9BACT|nr:MAG: hypothetical protein C5B42_01350 [Candidatus Cerribacteria bacterium 'Amazon FNV 2010 28 9']